MFQTKDVEKIKIHILYLIPVSPGNRAVFEIMWKNMIELDDNIEHAPCMLVN